MYICLLAQETYSWVHFLKKFSHRFIRKHGQKDYWGIVFASKEIRGNLDVYYQKKYYFFFLRPHLQHMEVPRLGMKLEVQLQTYTTAIATLDLSHICDLCCSLWQHQILNPLSEARDQACIFMDTISDS